MRNENIKKMEWRNLTIINGLLQGLGSVAVWPLQYC